MDSERETLTPVETFRLFLSAVVLAFGVRIYLFWQYYLISSDGVHYIDAARDFLAGQIPAGLSSVYPPAYPVLIASVYSLVGDWELSGQIWSLFAGVLVLLPLYVLLRRIYGENVALIACFLAALSPYLARYSVHVRTESPFLLLSTAGLVLFHQGIEEAPRGRFFYGGVVAGLAYLVRPEAIGFLVIVPFSFVLRSWLKGRCDLRLVWAAGFLLLLGFSLFALPYIAYVSAETGQGLAISRKVGITLWISLKESGLLKPEELDHLGGPESLTLLRFASEYPLLFTRKLALDLIFSIGVFLEAVHYSYVPFLLIGLFQSVRRKFWERGDLLLFAFVVFYLVGFALIYPNRRYAVQLVPVSLGWTAIGVLWCWNTLKNSLRPRAFLTAAVFLAGIFFASTLPKTLKPISHDKAHIREAGQYLRKLHGPQDLKLLVSDDRIAFYAGAERADLSRLGEGALPQYLKDGRAHYVVEDARLWRERYPRIAHNPERYGLFLEREFGASEKERVLVVKVRQGDEDGGTR